MMKTQLSLIAILLLSLTACFDIADTIQINADGSGVYEQKMDISRALSLSKVMGRPANSDDGSSALPEMMDTTFSMKPLLDTVTHLSAAEKAIMSRGTLRLRVDETAGECYFVVRYPFRDANEFAVIQQAMTKGNGNSAFAALGNVMGNPSSAGMAEQIPMIAGSYSYELSRGKLTKKAHEKSSFVSAANDTEGMPEWLREMSRMRYSTTVILPKPIKKWSGNNGTISDDKKQLHFTKQVEMNMPLTADDFNFQIDF